MDLWLAPHDFRVRSQKKLGYGFADTPFGKGVALANETHLLALYFSEDHEASLAELRNAWPQATLNHSSNVDQLITEAIIHPEKIAVMAIGTPFQLTVWEYLRSIPSGITMTYGELASAIARPGAARAVGKAVGANEISLVIPCHRVVSEGKLTGYRWGLERKKQILARELANQLLVA